MKWFKLLLCLLMAQFAQSQVIKLDSINFDSEKSVNLKSLSHSEDASSYVIEIKDTIKPHYHKVHTELIYVLEGRAKFYFKEKTMHIEAGDFFEIPRNAVHAVKVTSEQPLKVISIQAPEFNGEDRIFIEQ